MADELLPKDEEARNATAAQTGAAKRLRSVGIVVTFVWVVGLGLYVCGLGLTDAGWRWPRIDPRAWRENVGFLVDWTSLILASGSFIALLYWPKSVVEIIADLWAIHSKKLEKFFLRMLSRIEAGQARGTPSRGPFPSERENSSEHENSSERAKSPELAKEAFDDRPAPSVKSFVLEPRPQEAAKTSASRQEAIVHPHKPAFRRVTAARGRIRSVWFFNFFVLLIVALVAADWPQPPDPPDPPNPPPRSYVMREGDSRGAVKAITRGIRDPLVRAQCIEALESDPMNQPPHDRRQRPGHVVLLPDACPTP